jgi:hypothetical protein
MKTNRRETNKIEENTITIQKPSIEKLVKKHGSSDQNVLSTNRIDALKHNQNAIFFPACSSLHFAITIK